MSEKYKIENLSAFTTVLAQRHYRHERGYWVFRGHSSLEYKLVPKVGRVTHTSKSRQKFEQSIFTMFKRNAVQYVTRVPSNNWEWLALAQHHGLATRLLDWSFNPMVALYFAVEERVEEDGVVYALHGPRRLPQATIDEGDPFAVDKLMRFVPNIVAPRVWVQEGLFTIHANIESSISDDLQRAWLIDELIIPLACKARIRYELYRQGVHRAALFPDLDGLTAHLQWQHGVHPDQIFT